MVFEAEASGGGEVRQVVSPPFLSPFPPLPLSIPPKFSDKPVGGKARSSEGEVPWLPPYKHHPVCEYRGDAGAEGWGFGVSPFKMGEGLWRGLCPSPEIYFFFFASEWCILRSF